MPGTCSEMVVCPTCQCAVQSIPLHNQIDHPELVKPWQHETVPSRDGWTGD